MTKLNWQENSSRENMRPKDSPPFEWWSAEWFVIGCHVHNIKGRWKYKINGVRTIEPSRSYATKEYAFDAVEEVIQRYCEMMK